LHQCCGNRSDGEREGREKGEKKREGEEREKREREREKKRGEGKISQHADKRQFQFGRDLVRSVVRIKVSFLCFVLIHF
jgi:hypothetical protein